jgi:hypothetical protein
MNRYNRTLSQLKEKAVLFWPPSLLEQAGDVSVLPLLLKTQDKFISILTLSDSKPDAWKKLLDISEEIQANIFLKHLMVLSNLGGEALNKYPPLSKYFNDSQMEYTWRGKNYIYKFQQINQKVPLNNQSLKVDGKSLLKGQKLNARREDVIMLILYASSSTNNTFPEDVKEKCMIGSLIGNPDELKNFVKQNYIRVSPQVSGATATTLGKFAEAFVLNVLKHELPEWKFKQNGKIPGIGHTDDKSEETTFDIVAISPNRKYFAIEVSFQFTTNGTIERKAREAKNRANLLHQSGHYICYVIDGAGNINIRERAVSIICQFSDCTVTFSEEEISFLSQFLKDNL